MKEFTELGRRFSGTNSVVVIWTARSGHAVAAFEASLTRGPQSYRWQHELGLRRSGRTAEAVPALV